MTALKIFPRWTQIATNDFVKRQTPDSRFSHFSGSWEELELLVVESWERCTSGYRDGVILVRVPTSGFYSSIVELQEGDKLIGGFEPRRGGEDPRKFITILDGQKAPAQMVEIVLYASKVLAEDGDNQLPPEDGNWEIISINASPLAKEMPISPMVLMHNHFGSTGGTATHLSNERFVTMLRESFEFWKNKASCG